MKSLATEFPHLVQEWSPKNGNLTPCNVAPQSNAYAFWICARGHEWKAKISNRTALGRGCPYCSGLKLVPENSLAQKDPALAAEWHPTKNGELKPQDVAAQSNRYAWWMCAKGHEWKAQISQRANGSGCPYCSNKSVNADNNLEAKYPQLASEWDFDKNAFAPHEVVFGSHKKVWWKCAFGHEWEAKIVDRVRGGTGCPRCAGHSSRLEVRIYSELKTIFPKATWRQRYHQHEIDVYLPEIRTGIEFDGRFWHAHSVERDNTKTKDLAANDIQLIRVREKGLPLVAGVIVPYHRNDRDIDVLVRICEQLVAANRPEVTAALGCYLKNRCIVNDKEYRQILTYLPGPPAEQSLASLYPAVSEEWNAEKNKPLRPEMFYPKSNQKVWWKCSAGHEWLAVIANRLVSACPYCQGSLSTSLRNFAVLYPELLSEWDYRKNVDINPYSLTPNSHTKVWWKCAQGHEWQTTVHHRAGKGRGCPYCRNQKVCPENSLLGRFPEIAAEWNTRKNGDLKPEDVTAGTKKKVWWQCKAGHEWEASVCGRTGKRRGCPYCAGQLPTNENNLLARYPKIAAQWIREKNLPLEPASVLPKSDKKVWWRCSVGHEWTAAIKDRTQGNGCPYCSGKELTPGRTLGDLHPELLAEWHPTKNGSKTPFDFSVGSSKKAWWQCANGHEWEAVIASRSKGHGCGRCHRERAGETKS